MMPFGSTAILQLRNSTTPLARELVRSVLRPLRGIEWVEVDGIDQLVAVRFDERITNAAEIVRLVEDLVSVSSVATRRKDQNVERSKRRKVKSSKGGSFAAYRARALTDLGEPQLRCAPPRLI